MSRICLLTSCLLILAFALFTQATVGLTQSAPGAPMILPVDEAPLIAFTDKGEQRFTIEIADTAENMARGLMFRETMDDDHGMLFVFGETRRASFWMRNTPMPLDLVFIGEDGYVRAVLQGEPFSLQSIGPEEPVRFVLEIRAGIAQETGIEAGTRLSHPRIDAVAGSD